LAKAEAVIGECLFAISFRIPFPLICNKMERASSPATARGAAPQGDALSLIARHAQDIANSERHCAAKDITFAPTPPFGTKNIICLLFFFNLKSL
jgi:hypothetical protein